MQAVFEASKAAVFATTQACSATKVYREECLKLGRYVAKVALVLAEIELTMHEDESLRGSEALFMAGDATVNALQQAQDLTRQCADSDPARIWPMEDAVEFQSVSLELLEAMTKLSALSDSLPEDIIADARHFCSQLQKLKFTTAELEQSEQVELEEEQSVARQARHDDLSVQEPKPMPGTNNIKPFNRGSAAGSLSVMDKYEELEAEAPLLNDSGGTNSSLPHGIPPPDLDITETLDKVGVAYMSLEDPLTTALPPGFHGKGNIPATDAGEQVLPRDPFSMNDAAAANTRLASTTLKELKDLNGGDQA